MCEDVQLNGFSVTDQIENNLTGLKSFGISFHIVGLRKDEWRRSVSVSARGILFVNLEVCLVSLILVAAEMLKPFMI